MNDRVLDFSEQPAFLSVRNRLLVIRLRPVAAASDRRAVAPVSPPAACSQGGPAGEDTGATEESETGLRSERTKDPDEHTIPLEDIAVVIASHPQISYTQTVLAGLAAAGGIFVACNEKHLPIAMLLPLESHSTQTERFGRQAEMPLPLKKRLWQQIVRAKLRAQARLLEERTGRDWGLSMLASQVRSGDPKNLEARAARIYWKNLFGAVAAASPPPNGERSSPLQKAAGGDTGATEGGRLVAFHRDFEAEGVNACLNYGYAVLRAIVARALCGAGLHPGLGLHHHNRYNPFCLADDLMEPFRPVVDRAVAMLRDARGSGVPLDKESKKAILEGLLARFTSENESRTLFDWVGRSAASLVTSIESGEHELFILQI